MRSTISAIKTALKQTLMWLHNRGHISLKRCQRIYDWFDLKGF